MRKLISLVVITTSLVIAQPSVAPQAHAYESVIFVVNSTLDKPDGVLDDGRCTTPDSETECTLRAAIMAGNYLANTTIQVPAGIYTLTLPPVEPWHVPSWFGHLEAIRPMTITGAGADKTIIDGNRDVIGEAVMVISSTAVISGVTIQNGAGGIFNAGASEISHVVIKHQENVHVAGAISNPYVCGGICNFGTLTVTNSEIRENRISIAVGPMGRDGYGSGAGISSSGGRLVVVDSIVSNNFLSATYAQGGGISSDGTLVVANSVITGNTLIATWGKGGGIYSDGNLSVVNSEIGRNAVVGWGGGIAVVVPDSWRPPIFSAVVLNSVIHSNSAQGFHGNGGGIHINLKGPYCPRGCFSKMGTASIVNSTISGNHTDKEGSGISSVGMKINVEQSTIAYNTSLGSIGIEGALVRNSVFVGDVWSPLIQPCERCDTESNLLFTSSITASTVISPLANNGGPTLTHALPPGSPAINAGGKGCVLTDQRGVLRPYGGRCDLGAFEAQDGEPPSPPIFLPVI